MVGILNRLHMGKRNGSTLDQKLTEMNRKFDSHVILDAAQFKALEEETEKQKAWRHREDNIETQNALIVPILEKILKRLPPKE